MATLGSDNCGDGDAPRRLSRDSGEKNVGQFVNPSHVQSGLDDGSALLCGEIDQSDSKKSCGNDATAGVAEAETKQEQEEARLENDFDSAEVSQGNSKTESQDENESDRCGEEIRSKCFPGDDGSDDEEDELGRKHRLSALKIVQESDSFMDMLRKAKTEIDDLTLTEKMEDLTIPDQVATEDKAASGSGEGYRVLLDQNPVQSSTKSCLPSVNYTSFPAAKNQIGQKMSSKETELNAWIEKGVWMKPPQGGYESIVPDPNSELRMALLSTRSNGGSLERYDNLDCSNTPNPATSLRNNISPYTTPGEEAGLDASLTDTEIYMTGAPREFTIDTEESNEEAKDVKPISSSSISFVSFSPEEIFATTTVDASTENELHSVAANLTEDFQPQSPGPSKGNVSEDKADGKSGAFHTNIYFSDDYDGPKDQLNPEATVLWNNSKYFEGCPTNKSSEVSYEHDQPDHETLQYINRVKIRNDVVSSKLRRCHINNNEKSENPVLNSSEETQENPREISQRATTASPTRATKGTEQRDGDGLNSRTESTYDDTYLGRADIFRPILTTEECKMLGVNLPPDNLSESEQSISKKFTVDPVATPQALEHTKIPQPMSCEGFEGYTSITKVGDAKYPPSEDSEIEVLERIGINHFDTNSRHSNLKELKSNPIISSRCAPEEYDYDDYNDRETMSGGKNSIPFARKTKSEQKQRQRSPEPNPSESSKQKSRTIFEELDSFYASKKDLKKELSTKIKYIQESAKLSSSQLMHLSGMEMQEVEEFRKNELLKIESETKLKTFAAKQDYKKRKQEMKQDSYKGALRKLIDSRRQEKEMRKLKLEGKLAKLDAKFNRQKMELVIKADAKQRKSDRNYRKKWKRLNEKMQNDCFVTGGEGYAPVDDLFLDNLEHSLLESDSSDCESDENLMEKLIYE